MIRRGKSDGWLKLPHDAINSWSAMQGAELSGLRVSSDAEGEKQKGASLRVTKDGLTLADNPLIQVPRELVLSRETVEGYARSGDGSLRDVLEAAGDFAQTSRGAVLIFLLIQATHSCPDLPHSVDDERTLLAGTSLQPALHAKVRSLYREFDELKSATSKIGWCQQTWWDEIDGVLTFDDWLQLDAMYRSRALEFPNIGDAMVPLVDMANHASGNDTGALYECSQDGAALLLLREGRQLRSGEEVTITYGDEKGACEMLFSYGFIENGLDDARDIFLELRIPDDDPLKRPKEHVSAAAPGVRIYSRPQGVHWVSDYVWIICVNEEDGLQFKVAQTTDGGRELQVFWKERQLETLSELEEILRDEQQWDLFQLRAIATIQPRVIEQLDNLLETEPGLENQHVNVREGPAALARELRRLEIALLRRATQHFENEVRQCRLVDPLFPEVTIADFRRWRNWVSLPLSESFSSPPEKRTTSRSKA
ncbi:hypothetical protein FH972_021856 [Carpinus fangiana]|uniref:SET domain-containing protein n=1 Tax=Carpinus fangiana TaxID=176857 RepID=A0A5N6KQI9_9ROSI|nr:hypothetical protein FH972_021856 [Carpinus fangiana]